VHDALGTVGNPEVGIPASNLLKVVLLARRDILNMDVDEVIPVGPIVFMVEAQGVDGLVDDDSVVDAATGSIQAHVLSSPKFPDVGPAASLIGDVDVVPTWLGASGPDSEGDTGQSLAQFV